jgi:hypothetical protein
MDLEVVMKLVGRWGGTLKFFPSDAQARIGIAEQLAAMATNEDQLRWLVARVAQLFPEWPGMLEVRAVFCTRYRSADGVEAALGTSSPAYMALCPEEASDLKQLAGQRQITGNVSPLTDDPEMQELIRKCAKPREPLRGVKSATEVEIEALKAEQNRNRQQPEQAVVE